MMMETNDSPTSVVYNENKDKADPVEVRKDGLLVYLLFNIVLLMAISISVASSYEHARMFTYGWTWRVGRDTEYGSMLDQGKIISADFQSNNETSVQGLGALLDRSFAAARCVPVSYDSAVQWSDRQVSPSCNCIRNAHVDYARLLDPSSAAIMRADGLDVGSEMQRIKDSLLERCFNRLRHTQASARIIFIMHSIKQ
jgi:hypothetical protein